MQYYSQAEALEVLKGPTFEMLLNKEFKAYYAKGGEGIPALVFAGLGKGQISAAFKHLGQYPLELKKVQVVGGGGESGQEVNVEMFYMPPGTKSYSLGISYVLLEDLEFPEHSLPTLRAESKWQEIFRNIVLDVDKFLSGEKNVKSPEKVEPDVSREPKVFLTTANTAVRKGIMALQKRDKTDPNLWGSVLVEFPVVVEKDNKTEVSLVKVSLFELDMLTAQNINPKAFLEKVKKEDGYKILAKWTLDLYFKGAVQVVNSYRRAKEKPSASVMASEAVKRLQKSLKIWSK